MRIALASDERYPVHAAVATQLTAAGHEVVPFGALAVEGETPWALTAEKAAQAVASEHCDEGIFFCWSGTGICMAANKVAGVRAALVWDAGGAKAARVWNHANVLCLSNRYTTAYMAGEIIEIWLTTEAGTSGAQGVEALKAVDARHRQPMGWNGQQGSAFGTNER